jgi:putative solute:sodium symporter small subunit
LHTPVTGEKEAHMTQQQLPPDDPSGDYRVNLFRPRPGFMRKEAAVIWIMLAGWAFLTFGFQLLLVLVQSRDSGESALTAITVFGFPFHYWFTSQFLILWFILLCFLFNVFIDRLTEKYRKRR